MEKLKFDLSSFLDERWNNLSSLDERWRLLSSKKDSSDYDESGEEARMIYDIFI